MSDLQPLWRKAFDAVEHRVGPPLEQAVQTEQFADVTAALARLQGQLQRRTERFMRRGWHFWNLPAGSDVKRMSEQLASLERRVRDLSKQLEDAKQEQERNQREQGGTARGKPTQPDGSRRTPSA
jgi:DNA repair exonuclease SbcCD ATPase subunit